MNDLLWWLILIAMIALAFGLFGAAVVFIFDAITKDD